MNAKLAWQLSKGTISEFMEDNVLRLAAALAYYAMFSLGPLLVLVIAVAGLFLEKQAVQTEVIHQIQAFIGSKAAETVQSMFSTETHGSTVLATILGSVALLFGATGVFGQLQDALNTIWEVQAKPGQGVWSFIRTRFLSFTMVLGVAFLLLISMVITTVLEAFGNALTHGTALSGVIAKSINFGTSFLVVTLLFAMIFRILPDVKIRWRDVWIGALGTSFLFTVGKYLMAVYLGQQSANSAYGAAGSVVVILLWVYYSSLILFFGAEFTQVYAKLTGSKIVPSPNAERVTEQTRQEQGIPHRSATAEKSSTELTPTEAAVLDPSGMTSEGRETLRQPYSVVASALGAGLIGGWWLHHTLIHRAGIRRNGPLSSRDTQSVSKNPR